MKTTTPRTIKLKDYRPPSHLIDTVALDVKLDAHATTVRVKMKLRANPISDEDPTVLALDGEQLRLLDIKLDGKALAADRYTVAADTLTLTQLPDRPFTLEMLTEISPETNKALTGLYLSNGIYCTQCEAEGFRRITYFLDRPDVLSVYTCRIEADVNEAGVLLSNGNLRERGTLNSGRRHYAIWKDPHPKPCYLFALVGGNLSSIASEFTTMSGRRIDLTIYVEPGKEHRCGWAMDSLKRSMAWDEKRFGREYDLDVFNIVAVADFNMGAMENKGLNIFNDRLVLASPETATDAIYEAIESVIAHEYFHNWTGNRITCRDWFQLCLKEGLTVYRDQEFSADERSRPVQRISDVRRLRSQQFAEDGGPLAHPVRPSSYIEINNFYTATVYEKGAELVRMIETIVGRAAFDAGLTLYFERHDGQAATVEEFLACFAQAAGRDLSQFMRWYEQAGTPLVKIEADHDRAAKTLTLTFTQSQPATPGQATKQPLHIPIRLGLIDPSGEELPLITDHAGGVCDGIVHLTRAQQSFTFQDIEKRPVLSVLRGFSAPVRAEREISEAQLAFLMRHDRDGFARWQAASDLALRVLLAQVRYGTDTAPLGKRIAILADALADALDDATLEPAYRAELIKFPTTNDIIREIGKNVDPLGVHIARTAILAEVARRLSRPLSALYEQMEVHDSYAPTAEQAGRRALRNACLTLLSHIATPKARARLQAHYDGARNMTDLAHALTLFAHGNGRARRAVLENFYERWKDDHLVLDTWFAAQASAPSDATLARTRSLLKHPGYNATTPNKIRAVVGTFAMQNPVQFNRPDGRGYAFVAEQVLAIDAFNPQVAARLLGAFRSWRIMERGRRSLAQKTLEHLRDAPNLSRDVYEIVKRILD
ncbi:MAG: aminopeptidase N [Hyphomicrobiaceae bacterium]